MSEIENRVDKVLTNAEIADLRTDLNKVERSVKTFAKSLTKEERKGLVMMDVSNSAFTEDAVIQMKNCPEIFPAYLSAEAIDHDLTFWHQLNDFEQQVKKILELITDTRMLAGHEAIRRALTAYKLIKAAAKEGVPGADTAYHQLKKRFDGQGRTKKEKQITES